MKIMVVEITMNMTLGNVRTMKLPKTKLAIAASFVEIILN